MTVPVLSFNRPVNCLWIYFFALKLSVLISKYLFPYFVPVNFLDGGIEALKSPHENSNIEITKQAILVSAVLHIFEKFKINSTADR
jgi:hypothetical protein